MICGYWLRISLATFLLCIELVCCLKSFQPRTLQNPEFTKIVIDSTGKNIYVGGKNFIYHLNEDLTQLGVVKTGPKNDSKSCTKEDVDNKVSTCKIELYDDYTQLLQVYEPGNILVTCGTLYLGRCVGRDLQNISIENLTSTDNLVVSPDKTGSSESVIAPIETESFPILFVGKSLPVQTTDKSKKNYNLIYGGQLQSTSFLEPFETESGRTPFSVKTKDQGYRFVVKGMFYMSKWYVFSLVTIVDQTTSINKMVSKVSKMCTSSTENSYEDMPIKCSGFPYVQDGFVSQLGNGSEVLVALFSLTMDVTGTTPSAVCVYSKEEKLLEGFRKSRISPPSCDNPQNYPVGYLEITGNQGDNLCINNDNCTNPVCKDLNKPDYCNIRPNKESLIGVVPLEASPVYSGKGLTSLGGNFRNNLTTILVGTKTGSLHKLFLKSEWEARLLTTTNYLNQPIIDIVTTSSRPDRAYLLGSYSVALVENQPKCAGSSCSQCMQIPDSNCGWCLLDRGSCVEKAACREADFWLPSVGDECLTLSTDPSGIKHDHSGSRRNVTVSLSPLVPLRNGEWQCQYGTNECKGAICVSALLISGSTMKCQIQHKDAFRKPKNSVPFKIIGRDDKNTTFVLANETILFYDCTDFETCFDCVNNSKVTRCTWDISAAECGEFPSSDSDENLVKSQDASGCPQLPQMQIKLHNGKKTEVVIQAENLPSDQIPDVLNYYSCKVNNVLGNISAVNRTAVGCNVQVSNSNSAGVEVKYKNTKINHNGTIDVEVYKCEDLTTQCSSCLYLNSQGYQCGWVNRRCTYTTANVDSSICPPPIIDRISPGNGTISGKTSLTIEGRDLGSNEKEINITVSGIPCSISNFSFYNPHNPRNQWIQCSTGSVDRKTEGGRVIVTRKSIQSNTGMFDYLIPELRSLHPKNGINLGGRILTLKGNDLLSGNLNLMTVNLFNEEVTVPCNIFPHAHIQRNKDEIICVVGSYSGDQLPYRLTGVNITYDNNNHILTEYNINFTFVDKPKIMIGRSEAIKSGGVDMNITGERFSAVSVIRVNKDLCTVVSDTKVNCPTPAYNNLSNRRKRSTSCPCYQFSTLHMDNYNFHFNMMFTENPTVHPFEDTVSYKAGSSVTIEGEDLLLGAVESDYMVEVHSTNSDAVKVNVNGTRITFQPPDFLSKGKEYQVEVLVGASFRQYVGDIYYEKDLTITIISAVSAGVFAVMLTLVIYCLVRNRQKDSQISKLKTDMVEMEDNIKSKSREVFADIQTSIQDIKGDLVSTGIPYFDYHNYSLHTLFPKLKAGESIYYQASAMHKAEDFARQAPSGILAFEGLLKNKFFLKSLIGTLEKQNNFSVQEKAEFSSLLALTMLGKMTYLSELIEELLKRLIGGASRKQHRVLFRRSDSITQKLLSNWLALSLYPYLKGRGGQQLFMLYKAIQTVMEKGPIDAVTLEAKDTLAEERLLKMDLKYEPLTLEVDLNGNKNHRYKCRVLDCDTITQVKAKCMYTIYKNKPASDLQFKPEELILEWHAGRGGKLVLNDIDRTSTKREGYICRNTLKHYNVKDGSCMALLISDEPEDPELYINSESASMNDVLLSEHSATSYMSMSPDKQWHLVFPEDDEKEGSRQNQFDELYLNRLLYTKLTLVEYIDAVFENVLDDKHVPSVVCYLFKMLEKMANDHNVDSDIVSCWKSECYAMRIWSLWIGCPDLLFDIILAKHAIPCLDVVKSVFSDVFSRTSSKLTKDSSSSKLLFANEVPKFQGKMRMFYDKLASSVEPVTEQQFMTLMQEVSQQQTQEIRVKKLPALKKLYTMVKKYSDEIIADLDDERETKDLQLGLKFDSVIQQMDTDTV